MSILARSVMTNRWLNGLICYAAGALMTLGFAPYHFWPVIFISLPVLFIQLMTSTSYKQAIWRGFSFGYGFYMVGTWWIANALLVDADKFAWLLPFSVLGLSAVMAFWFIVFAVMVHYGRARPSIITFAALWVIVEVFRSIGMFGFPWNLTGYMALASLPFAQTASHIGVYGLSFLITLLGLMPVYLLGGASRRSKYSLAFAALLFFTALWASGHEKLKKPTEYTDVTIRVVQPSIPQDIKSAREGREMAVGILGELSTAPAEGKTPDIVIWPETAYPFGIEAGLHNPVPKVKLLLTGAVRRAHDGNKRQVWNSFVALNAEGEVLASYDKHQLVPFGEFVPLRDVLPLDKITPGDIDFSRGAGPQTISIDSVPKFSPLICYEGIFPWMATKQDDRPQWMVNVTNDGWYGDTAGPYQHFDMVRMRAIEQGLPMVRVANSGISALIDPRGRIINALQLNQRGYFDALLPRP